WHNIALKNAIKHKLKRVNKKNNRELILWKRKSIHKMWIDQKDFSILMPLVCSEVKVVVFAFQSLHSVKTLYKEAKKENKEKTPFKKKKSMLYVFYKLFFNKKKVFIGTKYDLFDGLPDMYKQQSRKFAQKIHAQLVYCARLLNQ
ncbi:hypothetical protein RFI_01998, partial [Reticulomyxa filosa]